MNHPKKMKELKTKMIKNKSVGKTGEISSKFPEITGRNFEKYQ